MKKFIWLCGVMHMSCLCNGQPLQHHLWKHRVVLVFASNEQDDAFQRQYRLWTTEPGEVTDRQLILYQIFKKGGIDPEGKDLSPVTLKPLIARYGPLPDEGLKFVLIGKDGTVKMEHQHVVTMTELFARIDQMPMRRMEMQRQKN
ncbi:MAG: DUF4174 domain-containing protein [Mameliella sp.]|nr:DUF4174 domain-containing protein [Phaeodactylibacter sp.]